MSAPDPTRLAPEMRGVLLAVLRRQVETEEKLAKAQYGTALSAGVTLRLSSPLDGSPLGSVLRTDPKPDWRVVDERALLEHYAEYPNLWEPAVYVVMPDGPVKVQPDDEIVRILREHGPHLLIEEQEIPAQVIADALTQSRATGEPAAPGIAQVRPGGVVQVRAHKDAAEAVARWVRSGKLDWSQVLSLDPAPAEAAS